MHQLGWDTIQGLRNSPPLCQLLAWTLPPPQGGATPRVPHASIPWSVPPAYLTHPDMFQLHPWALLRLGLQTLLHNHMYTPEKDFPV